MKHKPTKEETAAAFLQAVNAVNTSTPENRQEAHKAVDLALDAYRKAHRLKYLKPTAYRGAVWGFMDCVEHYNNNYSA